MNKHQSYFGNMDYTDQITLPAWNNNNTNSNLFNTISDSASNNNLSIKIKNSKKNILRYKGIGNAKS